MGMLASAMNEHLNVLPEGHPTAPIPGALAELPELAAIYEENSRAIYYLALRFLGDPTQAEDATHDVFLKAYRGLKGFKGKAAVRTWLYRIAINHCQNLLRSWHHRNVQTCPDDSVWNMTPGNEECPFRVLATQELGERIQKSLDSLPEEYRLILLLVADDKLAYEEVAELTSQSVDAVRGKLHRARKAFAGAFQQND
jgi:RNA polymerase sigma-70 factor (ECF subfamily)